MLYIIFLIYLFSRILCFQLLAKLFPLWVVGDCIKENHLSRISFSTYYYDALLYCNTDVKEIQHCNMLVHNLYECVEMKRILEGSLYQPTQKQFK